MQAIFIEKNHTDLLKKNQTPTVEMLICMSILLLFVF